MSDCATMAYREPLLLYGHTSGMSVEVAVFRLESPLFEPWGVRRSQRSCVRRLPVGECHFACVTPAPHEQRRCSASSISRSCLSDRWVCWLSMDGLVMAARSPASGNGRSVRSVAEVCRYRTRRPRRGWAERAEVEDAPRTQYTDPTVGVAAGGRGLDSGR